MASRTRVTRRKTSIATGFGNGGSRSTLIADLKSEKQEAVNDAAQARQLENDKKRQAAEDWANEYNRLKSLAEGYTDDETTLDVLKAEMAAAKKKFGDKSSSIDSLERAAVRNKDTARYNAVISGATPLAEFEIFVKERQKQGGDITHLSTLLAQGRANEDKIQYQNYLNGQLSFASLKEYENKRKADSGDQSKLRGYMSAALTNEHKTNDNLNRTLYESGQMDPKAYEAYLTDRMNGANSPSESASLRAAVQVVKRNEYVKGVNEVIDDLQSGRIDQGTALTSLHGMVGSTTDSTLQRGVQKHIDTIIQRAKADALRGAGGSFDGITAAMRAVSRGVTYNIMAVIEPENKRREMHLMCVRNVSNG